MVGVGDDAGGDRDRREVDRLRPPGIADVIRVELARLRIRVVGLLHADGQELARGSAPLACPPSCAQISRLVSP